jgi:chemosensory pili system protein ChpA (sensor histidine kinase/response regulator)
MNNDGAIVTAVAAEYREILPVFIQEAQDIIGHIPLQVSHLHAYPQKREVLKSIRRGFHTLKGSSRMVGLEVIAKVAWEVEQVLNHRLQERTPADTTLLKFVGIM